MYGKPLGGCFLQFNVLEYNIYLNLTFDSYIKENKRNLNRILIWIALFTNNKLFLSISVFCLTNHLFFSLFVV